MDYAKLVLVENVYLFDGSTLDIGILAMLLSDDIGLQRISSFKEFLIDNNYANIAGNYTIVEKKSDNVLLACRFDDDFEPCIQMPQQELLSILDQWEQLVKLRPAEITIFKKGDSYILKGCNPH
ncbi:MAG TPA: hypothetical protein VGT41_02890 [Candidatus Babeliales bacterium]|nr:hypothetical protein [Candidatus Babeliales bacterium]